MKSAIIPIGHPNRKGWKLESMLAYVVHSTANLRPGTGDEWHAGWFGRAWKPGNPEPCEADGKTPFRRGCTHIAFDVDSETQYLPFDEYAPGAGDRPNQWTPELFGQRPLAFAAFRNRQNWRTIQLEICEGGGWDTLAEGRAASWIIEDAVRRKVKIDVLTSINPAIANGPPPRGHVYIVRHYDITGKNCPSYFVRNYDAWCDFVRYIAAAVNSGQP